MLSQEAKLKLEGIKPLDKNLFNSIRDEFRPPVDLQGFKALREKAGRERDLREFYKERAPYELLQNADDAHATKVAYILTNHGVAFIHDGSWFTVDNFRSLADGWSDKNPQECIGHKGLGFRSVLDITPSPYIISLISNEFFGIKFSWALNHNHIQDALRKDTKAKIEYEKSTKNGQLVCPIMAIPGLANRQNLGPGEIVYKGAILGSYGQGFTTMFWFPAKDAELDSRVLDDLSPMPLQSDHDGIAKLIGFIEDEVCILLPFLASVTRVEVFQDDNLLGCASVERGSHSKQSEKITVMFQKGDRESKLIYFLSRCHIRIPREIKSQPDTPRALKQMDEVALVLMAEIKDGHPIHQPNSAFHVYFPTEENTGLGFTVHGDFYVKPDRTRLMPGKYNEWLLLEAAQLAANEFLTHLLKEYSAGDVFSALAPSSDGFTSASEFFVSKFAEALKKRQQPFVPTRLGLLTGKESLLPPDLDKTGFWDKHFTTVIPSVIPGKKAFLSPEEDGDKTRKFLKLAGVESLGTEKFLELLDIKMQDEQVLPDELYEYYEFMYSDPVLSRYDHEIFSGHRLLLVSGCEPSKIPVESLPLVCFPSAGEHTEATVPPLFSKVFLFINPRLSTLLDNGDERVKSWVTERLKVIRFEASELLPRAIRGIVAGLYSGDTPVSFPELCQIWIFVKLIIEASPRKILDPDFWREIGRLPLPASSDSLDYIPAFLAYWPGGFVEGSSGLEGISGIRRIDQSFLDVLVERSQLKNDKWIPFFELAGVSSSLKVLTYTRLIGSDQSLPIALDAPKNYPRGRFTGERQADENRAVIEALTRDSVWEKFIGDIPSCGHSSRREIQELTIFDGFSPCVEQALSEYRENNNSWQERLLDLLTDLPGTKPVVEDKAFCPVGRQGGHQDGVTPYITYQLEDMPWLPTTWGPLGSSECFSRLITRHFISTGRSDEALGDILLPYVVANSSLDLAKYEYYGVKPLEDPESASTDALIRALKMLGQKLSSDWARSEIIEVKSRWRLVRGAIQEIYRRLNQLEFDIDPNIFFASRLGERIIFTSTPIYYAEPGSPIEQAFSGLLPLFDADQVYARLFRQLQVIPLIPGESVDEVFGSENLAVPANILQKEIVEGIAPYLLAPIIARSEKTRQIRAIPRRLKERFSVRAADILKVLFSLKADSKIQKEVEYPRFYPQRIITPGTGATTEAGFILFVKGNEKTCMANLDADALGEALARIMLDGLDSGSDLTGLFPRITLRYKETGGQANEMRDYLLHQLGISIDAQDEARVILDPNSEATLPLPPPPAHLIPPRQSSSSDEGADHLLKEVLDRITEHQGDIAQAANQFGNDLNETVSGKTQQPPGSAKVTKSKGHGVTPEQEARGKKGELEILRRLQLPGGWEGFTFIADKREESVGYDFQCAIKEQTVYFEVKTFTPGGQVIMAASELQAAASSKNDYYLVGILDDGNPENSWKTYILPDPLVRLLDEGKFYINPKLYIPAAKVFDSDGKFALQ